jgi:hypothetical protein
MAVKILLNGASLVRQGTPTGQMQETILEAAANKQGSLARLRSQHPSDSTINGIVSVKLYNNAGGNPVKELHFNEAEFGSSLCQLLAVTAGSEGDAGSTDSEIVWNVDPTSFATGKLTLQFSGQAEGGTQGYGVNFLAIGGAGIPAEDQGLAWFSRIMGRGRSYYEMPFQVVTY